MWSHYKKTFVFMQILICLVTLGVFFGMNRLWQLAALYFVTMQIGAVLGAVWALRLRRKVERSAS